MAERLHFLDWFRVLMISCVVYAHLTFCGLNDLKDVMVDDRHFNINEPSPLWVRWCSLTRQWCIPLLFWVSGAACAVTFRGKPRGLGRIAKLTIVGMCSNAVVWLLGPCDPDCSILAPCPGKGLLFHFTVVPHAGVLFPYLNQMWYTVGLLITTIASWPLFSVISGHGGAFRVAAQWLFMAGVYGALLVASGDQCDAPGVAFIVLVCAEALTLAIATLCAPRYRPKGMPLRLLHYAFAAAMALQLSAPVAKSISSINASFIVYLVAMVTRFFQLGFLMTRPRAPMAVVGDGDGENGTDVRPFISDVWPIALIFGVLAAPSTNWCMAGNLTYPYLLHALDRGLYASGATVMMFSLDRVSRGLRCHAVPKTVGHAALILYLFHPALMTTFMWRGARSVTKIWLSSAATCVVIAAAQQRSDRAMVQKGTSRSAAGRWCDSYTAPPGNP